MYRTTKRFGHDMGLSCAFRQWKAESHCHFIHGYAFAVEMIFECATLDERFWVVDFGSFSAVKDFLRYMYDHTLLVAENDPYRETLLALSDLGLVQTRIVPATGCEATAKEIYNYVARWLKKQRGDVVRLVSVEVSEHGANSATYIGGVSDLEELRK